MLSLSVLDLVKSVGQVEDLGRLWFILDLIIIYMCESDFDQVCVFLNLIVLMLTLTLI